MPTSDPLEPSTPDAELEPEPLKAKLRQAALIGLLALTLNLAGNGRISLWDRDEPRYAACAREMRASGDWLHPTFNAEPRYHKPVLIYWLMLAGHALGGDNPFGARLVSALAGTGTCLLIWALGRRIFGKRAGLLAGLMAATAPILVVESKLAITDATLTFFLVACQLSLWELAKRPSKRAVGVFWAVMSAATLTKGPVGPVLIALSGLVSWWWGGPTECWRRLRWRWGLAGFTLLTAPWYIAIGIISKGDFYRVAMGYHVIRRMTTGIETHGGFPGYYLVGSLGVFYPWVALMPVAIFAAWSRRRSNPALGFVLGWIVGPWIFLECLGTRIIHYFLPAYPACVLLAAWAVDQIAKSEINLRRWPLGRVSIALLTGTGIGATVALLAGLFVLPPGLRWPCVALALVMGPGTLYAMERFQAGATLRATQSLVGTWAALLLIAWTWLLPAAEPYRISPIVGRRLAALVKAENAAPMMGAFKPPDVVYYLGQPATVIQSRDWLRDQARRVGLIAAPLTPGEYRTLKIDPDLVVELRDTVKGFNVESFRTDTIRLALIRPSASALARQPKKSNIQ